MVQCRLFTFYTFHYPNVCYQKVGIQHKSKIHIIYINNNLLHGTGTVINLVFVKLSSI